MCLTNVTTKFRKHTIGYKIFRRTSVKNENFKKPCFVSPFQGTLIPFGTWIDCRKFTSATPKDVEDYGYYPGWHYYLTKKGALKKLGHKECVIKISVKEIICVGNSFSVGDAGVSYYIKLDKVVHKPKNYLSHINQKVKDEIKSLGTLSAEMKNIFKIFNFKTHPTTPMVELFVTKMDSLDTFERFINLVDKFDRDSMMFKYFTEVHKMSLRGMVGTPTGIRYRYLYETLVTRSIDKYRKKMK